MISTTQEYIATIENKIIIDKDNGREIKFIKSIPCSDKELENAETQLGVKLPESFKAFLKYCGPADFYSFQILSLPELYRLDDSCWEMEGMIPFATDHFGRNHCFKPIDSSDEYEIYITSHDPFGYGKVAENFLEWCKLQNDMMLNFEVDEPSFKHPFLDVDKAILESWKKYKGSLPKKWYEFWK